MQNHAIVRFRGKRVRPKVRRQVKRTDAMRVKDGGKARAVPSVPKVHK